MFEDSIRVILVYGSWMVNTLLITHSKVFLTINYWRFLISREYLISRLNDFASNHENTKSGMPIFFKIPKSLHLSEKKKRDF